MPHGQMVAFDRPQGLFWSNKFGWAGLGSADTFTTDEVRQMPPPFRSDLRWAEWLTVEDARILVSRNIDGAR